MHWLSYTEEQFLYKLVLHQVFKQPWPGMMRTLYGNQARFESGYFSRFKGYYFAGDGELLIFFLNNRLNILLLSRDTLLFSSLVYQVFQVVC